MDSLGYLRFVLDRERLAVLGAVALAPRTPAAIAEVTGLPPRAVLRVLAPLLQDGTVERLRVGGTEAFRLRPDALRELAHDLPRSLAPAPELLYGMTQEEQVVLGRFFRGRSLTEIPASRGKRRVVLERLALEFEPGRHYPEGEVNRLLAGFHADVASLRRHLVDEGFLDRADGEYWRAGGRVEPPG